MRFLDQIIQWKAVALPALLPCLVLVTGCDWQPRNAEVDWGWVTNCVGPQFSKFARNGQPGPGPERPVFKINDQLVLAVPAENSPRSVSIDHAPRTCTKFSDLPKVPYVYFYFQGKWSGNVKVRIERKEALEDSPEIQEARRKAEQELSKDMYQVSGLTCIRGYEWCSAVRPGDSDVVRLKYQRLNDSGVAIYTGYASHKYGGSSMWWWTVTSDLAHWRDIDDEVRKRIAEWNLLSNSEGQTGY